MDSSLKKEFATLGLLSALVSAATKRPRLAALLSAGALGLYASSFQNRYDLQGKSAYITGGSRGLGLSLAWNLLERGAQVTLVAREREELERGREILMTDFPTASVFISVCDVTSADQLERSINEAIYLMGGIDLLINNAGSILVGPFESMTIEDFQAQMNLHLYAVIRSTQLIFEHFKSRGSGRILNICSLGGKVAVPHMLPYDASKFALAGFSQGIAAELAQHDISVTTVYPTVMRTGSPIQAVFKGDHEREYEWFASLDNLPGLSMSADVAAKKALNAVSEGKTEAVLSLPARIRLFGGTLFPETMNALMKLAASLLPQGQSSVRHTGFDSSRGFETNRALSPLKERAHRAEWMYNQRPHHDADSAMGISTLS